MGGVYRQPNWDIDIEVPQCVWLACGVKEERHIIDGVSVQLFLCKAKLLQAAGIKLTSRTPKRENNPPNKLRPLLARVEFSRRFWHKRLLFLSEKTKTLNINVVCRVFLILRRGAINSNCRKDLTSVSNFPSNGSFCASSLYITIPKTYRITKKSPKWTPLDFSSTSFRFQRIFPQISLQFNCS